LARAAEKAEEINQQLLREVVVTEVQLDEFWWLSTTNSRPSPASANPAVIFWRSAANGVFSSGCPLVFPPSRELADVYGLAAGYPVYDYFTSYAITGDAGDWLATQGISSITVELMGRWDIDWRKNLDGFLALITHYNK
jgi:hypothetical protein